MPKTEEQKAEIAQHHKEKKERLATEQAEYDSLSTPAEQVDHDLAKADETDKQIRRDISGNPGSYRPDKHMIRNWTRAQYYDAGIINADGTTREGITDPRQMLLMNWANRNSSASGPQGMPLRMTPFGNIGGQSRMHTGGQGRGK
jgi:hypothetical protein